MEEQERMARDLGKSAKAMILRNHGLLALGGTAREAFEVMYYLDCACQIQVDACAGGMENVLLMSQRAADVTAQQFSRLDRPSTHKDWPALLRLLERKGVTYSE
jgi:ribulose-5-phosphate 4-epimerase/fuculose-1-phosphate aldolase